MDADPKSSPEVLKLSSVKSFGKDISKLIFSANMLKSYDFVLHKLSDEMMLDINVLSPAMLNRIFRNINSTQVVTK